jgi:DNA-binding MarR family transcriptional regulator/N-acetylglutamate synthase-like GNAT family acetyltransferase
MDERVAQIRSFNRTVTRRVGVLDSSFLGGGLPLGHARLLFEIGGGVTEIRQLRQVLDLDSGYVSRILRSLERRGLLTTAAAGEDARVRVARLTAAGRAKLEELERRSEEGARSWLQPLTRSQQDRLLSAMAEVERWLRASEVEIRVEDPSSEAALWCRDRFFAELARRFDGGFDPRLSISADPEALDPPAGYFFVATLTGCPVGCGALKLDREGRRPAVGQVKRMWVSEELRGLGVGRRMLETIEAQAREAGVRMLRLETNRSLTEAQALYLSSGFREVEPFNQEPYAHVWFEKSLD